MTSILYRLKLGHDFAADCAFALRAAQYPRKPKFRAARIMLRAFVMLAIAKNIYHGRLTGREIAKLILEKYRAQSVKPHQELTANAHPG